MVRGWPREVEAGLPEPLWVVPLRVPRVDYAEREGNRGARLRDRNPVRSALDEVEPEVVDGEGCEVLQDWRDVAEVDEQGERRAALLRCEDFDASPHEAHVLRRPGDRGLVDLDLGRPRTAERAALACERVRNLTREAVHLMAVGLRERRERVGTREDGLHRPGCNRRGVPPLVDDDWLSPLNRSGHDRLAVVRVRVEVPHRTGHFEAFEAPRERALAFVPGDLTVRRQRDARPDLFANHVGRNGPLDFPELRFGNLALLESRDCTTEALLF